MKAFNHLRVIFLSLALLTGANSSALATTFENTWFSSQPPNMFTIQLVGINGDKKFSQNIAKTAPKETTTAVLSVGEEFLVVHGIYDNADQAVAAIEKLPDAAKKYIPRVQRIQTILSMEGFNAPKSGSQVLSGLAGQAADAISNIGVKDADAEISNFGPVPITVNKPTRSGIEEIENNSSVGTIPAEDEGDVSKELPKADSKAMEAEVVTIGGDDTTEEPDNLSDNNEDSATNDDSLDEGFGDVVTISEVSKSTSDGPQMTESGGKEMAGKEDNTPPKNDKKVAASDKFVDPATKVEPKAERAKKKPAVDSVANANPFKELVINPVPGVTELLVISRQHLNRIRTNFKEPIVTTIDDVEFKISDSTIYVSTTSTQPIALFISDGGAEETTIGMSLLPKTNVPPQQVYLNTTLAKHRPDPEPESVKIEGDKKQAHKYEIKDPYTKVIMSLLKKVADGEIPNGYSLVETRDDEREPLCRQPGMHYQFKSPGQQVVGDSFTVAIGVATNIADYAIEAIEEYCVGGQTAAVAFWPDVLLNPGASTEVYVVVKNWIVEQQYEHRERPNLLGVE